jgi:Tol biopolymer transport system component
VLTTSRTTSAPLTTAVPTSLRAALAAASLLLLAVLSCADASGPNETRRPVASVLVAPAARTLVVGETFTLGATPRADDGTPLTDRPVTWESIDPAVATVSAAGLVEARAEGQATIAARSEGREGRATITVTAAPALVASVELDATELTLAEGATRQLVATARDAQGNVITGRAVQWATTDPGIAAVSLGGLVVAVRPGAATVTATVEGRAASASAVVTADWGFDLVYDGWSNVPGEGPELYTLDVNLPNAEPARIFPAGRSATDPTVSPDGTRIAFVVGVGFDAEIWVAGRDGSGATRLTSNAEWDDQPAWSPDGRRIAFRRRPDGGGTDIWVMNADGSAATNLTADEGATSQSSPAWSPELPGEGYRVAYSHASNGEAHLYTMRADGTDKRPLTSGTVYDDEPAWSPDGTRIAYRRTGTVPSARLWVVNAATGAGAPLVAGDLAGPQFAPAWSPDGRLVAFVSRHESYGSGTGVYQLYTALVDGGSAAGSTVIARRTFDGTDKQNPAWIPRR